MRSANGWPVLTSRTTGPLPRLRRFVLPLHDAGEGANPGRHLLLRDGSAGFLLAHAAVWWDDKVERLDLGVWDEWGWAYRPIRGGTVPSNHSSGTAADLNATRHPLGVPVHATFTPAQVARIRRRMRVTYRGLVTWGGMWSRPDGMHLEISAGATLGQVEARARALMKTPRGRQVLRANPGLRKVIQS